MDKLTVKFKIDVGKEFKSGDVAEVSVQWLEERKLVEGEDYELAVSDDVFKKAIEDGLSRYDQKYAEAVTKEVDARIAALETKFASSRPFKDVRIELGLEPEDKDLRRGYGSLSEFARDVILAGSDRIPEQLEGLVGYQSQAITKIRKAHSAEMAARSARFKAVGSDELSTITGPYGSYLVPTEYRRQLMSEALESAVILDRLQPIEMASQKLEIPAIDDSSHSGGSVFGGIMVYRVKETGKGTESRPKIRYVELALHKQIVMIPATDELLRFSIISLAPMLGTLSAQALGWTLEGEVINGKGVGEPLGITNAPCLVSVARTTSLTVVAVDIDKMWQAMPQRYRQNSVWLINGDLEDDLQAMNRVVGVGGQLVYNPPGGIADAPYGTLKGRPVLITEHCQAAGTVGDILLVAPQAYLFAQLAGGVEGAVSIELRFEYVESVFRYLIYNDGRPWWNTSFTPAHGGVRYSPFVALAA